MMSNVNGWIGKDLTIKWALASYIVLLGFTWIAFSAAATRTDVNTQSIVELNRNNVIQETGGLIYDRCVASWEADETVRDLLIWVIHSSTVNNPDFQEEAGEFLRENVPSRSLLETCGETPSVGDISLSVSD